MINNFKLDEWKIIEEGFDPSLMELSESIFSIGNGYMGQRANFEETYSGNSLQGSYMAGIWYPDKTRVGWWKNGYPEFFAKVINSTNWIGLKLFVNGVELDLAKVEVSNFVRELNMNEGYLKRTFIATFTNGNQISVEAIRFVSMVKKEIGAFSYMIKPLNFNGELLVELFLDGDIKNKDANYGEQFWDEVEKNNTKDYSSLTIKTKKLGFYLSSTMKYEVMNNNKLVEVEPQLIDKEKFTGHLFRVPVKQNNEVRIIKYVANVTSRNYRIEDLPSLSLEKVTEAKKIGFIKLLEEHKNFWQKKWSESDIVIKDDIKAQQGIRFNIFQLYQTYTGEDAELNIGPKGFTGEKYGGSTYWDTEAYCLYFYLSTAEQNVAKNLLLYRYNHLEKAKENARKLGFNKGALYPMVTMNGEESHNEWEITFEEIHRNGAIAYAIYNYTNYTNDFSYLVDYGLEVLIEISRFWEERVNYTEHKGYVILGVTGPNEYENNVNNNWYTNRIAAWTLEYTLNSIEYVKNNYREKFNALANKINLTNEEQTKWKNIIDKMYYPIDNERKIFLQQDGFLDKELIKVKDLDPKHLPLNQHWSWDRILRSCFIKQADVLQGLFFLHKDYDIDTIRRNFDFYEPLTVHESSLSPSVHSILASELGYKEKAYELYLRTARLDLENYNNDTHEGLHITSMAGTWMSIVLGFGGLKVKDNYLILNPQKPKQWNELAFTIIFRGAMIKVKIFDHELLIVNESDKDIDLFIYNKEYQLIKKNKITIKI